MQYLHFFCIMKIGCTMGRYICRVKPKKLNLYHDETLTDFVAGLSFCRHWIFARSLETDT